MAKAWLHCIFILQITFVNLNGITGFCWKPNTSPFYGAPRVIRLDGGNNRVRVDWSQSFNDGDGCELVDFLIMMHPRNTPSAYTLSDFTLKGQRSATLQTDGDGDYVFQVSTLQSFVILDHAFFDAFIAPKGPSNNFICL